MDHLYTADTIPRNGIYTITHTKAETKVYKRRIWMLFLFSFCSMLCGMMFTMYPSMSKLNMCYYGVGQEAIAWTTMISMVVYIVLVFPVSYIIDCIDLKWTVICTALFNTLACAVQFSTLSKDSFPYVMVSSCLSSIANVFVLGVPPFLAAKWFPSNELSRACAFGVSGNHLGVALGFVIPNYMITSVCENEDLIAAGKRNVAIFLTSVNLLVFFLINITFQNAPKFPPSLSQLQKRNTSPQPYHKIVFSLMKNVQFQLIFVVNGLMAGTYLAIITFLNNMILQYFPNKEVEAGWMGLFFIVTGLVGSIIAGYILDRTHRFKDTSVVICIASVLSIVLFNAVLPLETLLIQFLAIGILGFFLTSFLPIGYEYAIEITYPLSELVCACMINTSTQIFGIIITEMVANLLPKYGVIISNCSLIATLFICCIVIGFVTKDYKRSKKNMEINRRDPI
ncbi:hypothetical protein JTE90_011907 [Oedothorax gibbosus]|uniref:Major facilitator superfamily (MFS) profile domain-containing protein n=1 Tax=Oedothorax gibbosus TaxID=931172 RepID=A0AAV6V0D6_9ARAC|nr:hypothetical protein JTE90_011907 [Oedothorax gibbosus]